MTITVYKIDPQPKPRMTRSDKWRKRPIVERYYEYCNALRALEISLPECGAEILFTMPMPPSWSKKKRERMNGRPHRQVPDLDNLVKALSDAVFLNDCHIWNYGGLTKLWGVEGTITISVPTRSDESK